MSCSKLGRPMEVLLVEDSRLDARLAIEALREGKFRHRLTLIPDGQEAILFLHRERHFARAPRPDLILLDLNLPGDKDGRDVLATVKGDMHLRDIPVVVLTGSSDESDRRHGELWDVDGYMIKPVDIQKFVRLLRDLIHCWDDEVVLPAMVRE